jgi:hypothetical protein
MKIKLSELKRLIKEQLETAEIQTRTLKWLSDMKQGGFHPSEYGTAEDILYQAEAEGIVQGEDEKYEAEGAIESWLAHN